MNNVMKQTSTHLLLGRMAVKIVSRVRFNYGVGANVDDVTVTCAVDEDVEQLLLLLFHLLLLSP